MISIHLTPAQIFGIVGAVFSTVLLVTNAIHDRNKGSNFNPRIRWWTDLIGVVAFFGMIASTVFMVVYWTAGD